jgi:multimeric flavodoxin WrbA
MEQLDKKINDKNIEKMVDSTLENIENKELEATLKKLAEDIFGK